MFGFGKKKILVAPVTGRSIPIENVKDDMFSKKVMGDGIAFEPLNGVLVAPCDGTISMVMQDSKHAVGIASNDCIQILLHIGLDTVSLEGKGFELLTEAGKRVKAGDDLIRFDRDFILSQGISTTTMLIILEESGKIVESYANIDTEAGKTAIIKYL